MANNVTDSETITVEMLRDLLEEQRPLTILDVRPAAEHREWSIPGSLHVDAYAALAANDTAALAGVDLPDDRPVITVCAAGRTSLVAAAQLRTRGLRALSLSGGMTAWSLAWNTAELPLSPGGARVIQVRRTGKGCLSYLVGLSGEAAVIDASLAPGLYLDLAQRYGWQIKHVLDTHVHADHLSRGPKLAAASGAAYYVPETNRLWFRATAVREGDVLMLAGSRLEVLHTPGHTPESASYLLDDQMLFTGDTLFLAAVGRPDLEASAVETEQRAQQLFHSLQRLLALPPDTLILPGHSSEPTPFDGQPLAASLQQVREQTRFLALPEEAFVQQLLARIPATPPNHERIVDLNEKGEWPLRKPVYLEAGANRCAIGS
jgi:glyoxylase-like metal-dependent hydrolase (beta-lactamase superfamily II)